MFSLINGKPVFYIGLVNGIGYSSEEEKERIVSEIKLEDENAELVFESVELDEDYKQKAIQLGELQLTYSKSEFIKYLEGDKLPLALEVKELQTVLDVLLGGELDG